MKQEQWVIIDWAWNYLQHTGKFNFSSGGTNHGSPMTFSTQDEGFEFMDNNNIDYEECACVELRPNNNKGEQ
jgi:hypothetical protein